MMDERMELIWARVGLPATTLKSRLREAPLYFNDRQLTAEQRARWPWAVQEYTRVIRLNIERQVSRMSVSDKESMLRSFPLHRRANRVDDDVREILHMFYGMSGGEGGDGHSALFARLLDGKPALDRPPPIPSRRPPGLERPSTPPTCASATGCASSTPRRSTRCRSLTGRTGLGTTLRTGASTSSTAPTRTPS